ncbi:hypothetical protein ACSFBF_10175 [Variovorax sp. ZT5P49]|uniref:hypothetical protein n=1 Tax=Variovorax sp. ZT5P49 TaxID=3443733 RepID=UPI003F4752D1
MAITSAQVHSGGFYTTAAGQLRKVTDLEIDPEGRTRVRYLSKSARIPNREFDPTHTIKNPPLLDTFVEDCDKELSESDVALLRREHIVLADE